MAKIFSLTLLAEFFKTNFINSRLQRGFADVYFP
jgi:hypothetical protein